MRNFLLFIALAWVISSCEQINRSFNGQKDKVEKSNNKYKTKTGQRVSRYPNGKLRSTVNYKNNIKHGEAKNYYENGKVKMAMTYKNGLKQGKAYFYYENGEIYRESNYHNGKLDGIRKIYRSGKKISAEIPYKNGNPGTGLKEYLINGELKTKYPKIIVKPVDARQTSNEYHLDIYFSKKNSKDEFYYGELLEGKFVQDDLYSFGSTNGRARFTIPVEPGSTITKKINIVGVHRTKQGNPYVTTRSYNLSVKSICPE